MSRKSILLSGLTVVTMVAIGAVYFAPPQSVYRVVSLLIGPSSAAQSAEVGKESEQPSNATKPSQGPKGQEPGSAPASQLLVTVVNSPKQTLSPLVTGFGEVAARWTTELTAEVSGRVDFVSDKLLAGSAFDKGDVLVRINSVDYESALAAAKADVASAQVAYLEQKRETEQAKKRWDISGLSGEPSALTLQTPQLDQATAELVSSKAALAKAEKDLARTEIVAPFNGRVSTREINLGGFVSSGTTVGEVFATDSIEINIALNEQQFKLLGTEAEAKDKMVTLFDTAVNDYQWTARIARFQYHIDTTERTRNLVLEVNSDHAAEQLMPGTFVKATIPGSAMANLLKLPASSLSRDGYIWYVEKGTLERFKADIKYRQDDFLVVDGLPSQPELQVVRYPQSAFIPGQSVKAEQVANVFEGDAVIQSNVAETPLKSASKSLGAES